MGVKDITELDYKVEFILPKIIKCFIQFACTLSAFSDTFVVTFSEMLLSTGLRNLVPDLAEGGGGGREGVTKTNILCFCYAVPLHYSYMFCCLMHP